jgi:hypothetical protein
MWNTSLSQWLATLSVHGSLDAFPSAGYKRFRQLLFARVDDLCVSQQRRLRLQVAHKVIGIWPSEVGWGGRTRTFEWRIQSFLSYQRPPISSVLISAATTDT